MEIFTASFWFSNEASYDIYITFGHGISNGNGKYLEKASASNTGDLVK